MDHIRLSEAQRDRYSRLITDFERLSVLVVGDCFLDDWMYGRPERLCREAPIPVMDVTHHRYFGGGAANAATNFAALGAASRLISVTGTDRDSHTLLQVLEEAGVDCQFVTLPQRGTVTKRRLVADRQIMFRVDEGETAETSDDVSDQLLARLDAAVAGADAVVICDYGSGTCTDRFIAGIAARRDRLPQLVVDAHEPARWNGVNADLMTPSFAEVAQLLPTPAGESDRAQVVEANSAELRSRLGARVVAVTLDSDGAVVSAPDQPCYRSYTTPVAAPATIGAGDCYTAAFTLALASGGSVADSAEVAQLTAAVAIGGQGTSACSAASLLAELAVPDLGPIGREELMAHLRRHRQAGRRIVFTNGCFDVLHRGHVSYLNAAKRLGDVLIVAVNSDSSIRRLKGEERPINEQIDRAAVLAALACVDHVVLFDEDSPRSLLGTVRPEIYVKGGDYTPELLPERELVESLGGEVRVLDYVPDRSTSAIIKRIRQGGQRGGGLVAEDGARV